MSIDEAKAVLEAAGYCCLTAAETEQVRDEIEVLSKNINGGWRDGQPWDKETRSALRLLSPAGEDG